MPLARAYVEQDGLSYERAVKPKGQTIAYTADDEEEDGDEETINERTLRGSTLCRLLSFLGLQAAAIQAGSELVNERDPSARLHRFVGAVAPCKYRSPERANRLRTARRLFNLIDHWNRNFAEPFFPRYATAARGP